MINGILDSNSKTKYVLTESALQREQLIVLLCAYLSGKKSLSDCSEWFSSLNWDDFGLCIFDTGLVGHLELLCCEAFEGLRPENEFREATSKFIGDNNV